MKKKFSLGAILNMSTGRLVTNMGDIYELANFMTGDNLFTHQLPRAFNVCQPAIKEQLPFLASPEMQQHEKDFTASVMSGHSPVEVRKEYIKAWLSKLQLQFGAEHEVTPLANWTQRNPIEELVEMRGGTDGIAVVKI